MTRYKVLRIGRPLDLSDFAPKASPRQTPVNRRDEELTLLVREVSAGPLSQVIPWELGDLPPSTARAAARRVIQGLDLPVYVGSHRAHPGTLFFSRQPLNGRGRTPG